MKLLLHTCCAPCSVACVQSLRAEGIEPTAYWFNPNIHPVTEYRARRDTLIAYAGQIGMPLLLTDVYGLRPFVSAVAEAINNRCPTCYAARMRATARFAAENGFTHFTSTLFISPYQQHETLRAAAEEAAEAFGVTFLYRDFRPLFRQGQEQARALGLYIQKYCGCVFSEEERYEKRYRIKKPAARSAGAATEAGTDSAPAQAAMPPDAELLPEENRRAQFAALREAGMRFEAELEKHQAASPANPPAHP